MSIQHRRRKVACERAEPASARIVDRRCGCGRPVHAGCTGGWGGERAHCLICETAQVFAGWVYDETVRRFVRCRGGDL